MLPPNPALVDTSTPNPLITYLQLGIKKTFLLGALLMLLVSYTGLYAQTNLSREARISVITCGPGTELYSNFGHSAFRVHDPLNGLDNIYNYGTFDFNAPNFYLNFVKGKLQYQLSVSTIDWFLRSYYHERRWVKAQVLNLNPGEVQELFNFLENNAKPENKDYLYDFFYDNCATKIETVLTEVLGEKALFGTGHIKTNKSHRTLIGDYTQQSKWGQFGIDLALGSVIDKPAGKKAYGFLPDYIYESFKHARIQREDKAVPMVAKTRDILQFDSPEKKAGLLTSPLCILSCIAAWLTFISYRDLRNNKRSRWVDTGLYLLTGLLGLILLFLWFATDHTATRNNANLLWAFAPNIGMVLLVSREQLPAWFRKYNRCLLLFIAAVPLCWLTGIQAFNPAIIPLIWVLAIRYLLLSRQ